MIEIPDLSPAEIAFPANATSWMPEYTAIPAEFRRGHTEWNKIGSSWFFSGLNPDTKFFPKFGVDGKKALAAVQAVLGSYAPKHEHKDAAVAYMLSEWFTKIEGWEK